MAHIAQVPQKIFQRTTVALKFLLLWISRRSGLWSVIFWDFLPPWTGFDVWKDVLCGASGERRNIFFLRRSCAIHNPGKLNIWHAKSQCSKLKVSTNKTHQSRVMWHGDLSCLSQWKSPGNYWSPSASQLCVKEWRLYDWFQKEITLLLAGGWTNPSQKYATATVKLDHFPK